MAVLAVILNHLRAPLLPGGYLGVDIFFVISGYVITASLLHRTQQPAAPLELLGGFWVRRVRRLVPALVVCVLITGLLVCCVDPSPGVSLRTGIASLFGVSNLYLHGLAQDYFAPASELNVFTHTWSLGVEEQFYLLYPLLFLASGCASRPGPAGRRRLALLLLPLGALSLLSFALLHGPHHAAAHYLTSSRAWELIAGCLLALLPGASGLRPSWLRRPPALVPALAALALVGLLFVPPSQGLPATLAVVLLSTLLIASLRPGDPTHRFFSSRPLVAIGLLSYSLYLWHWSVLSLSRWTIGLEGWALPVQLALMLLLAAASWRWIETPLRQRAWAPRRRTTLALGLQATGLTALGLALLGGPLQGRLYAGRLPGAAAEGADALPPGLREASGQLEAMERERQRCLLNPELLGEGRRRPAPRRDAAFLRSCLAAPAAAGPTAGPRRPALLLVGDSFSGTSAPHLALVAARQGLAFRSLSGFSCPYPLPFAQVRSATADRCPVVDEALLRRELLAALGPGDVLALHWHGAKSQYLRYPPAPGLPPVDAYDRPLLELAAAVRSRGARLLVIGGNPVLSSRHLAVLVPHWFNRGSSLAQLRPDDNPESRYAHRLDAHLGRLLAGRPGIAYLSVIDGLCGEAGPCPLRQGERPLFSDAEHLNAWGFARLEGQLERSLEGLLAGRPQ